MESRKDICIKEIAEGIPGHNFEGTLEGIPTGASGRISQEIPERIPREITEKFF